MLSELEKFAEIHGPYVMEWATNGNCFFADGASALGTESFKGGTFTDPPTDSYALLQAKRIYLDMMQYQEIKNFETFQQECLDQASQYERNSVGGMASSTPPPPANAKEQLLAGKERIAVLSERLAELDAEIAETPHAKNLAKRYEAQREHQAAARNQVTELMNLTL